MQWHRRWLAVLACCVGITGAGEARVELERLGMDARVTTHAVSDQDEGDACVEHSEQGPLSPKEALVSFPTVSFPSSCADPAVELNVELLNKASATQGRIRVTAVIRNAGRAAWVSTSYTHRLMPVLQMHVSASKHFAVKSPQPLTALRPGEETSIVYEADWTAIYRAAYPSFVARVYETGTPGSGKTPIVSRNCRSDNDRKEITAAHVNELFGALRPPLPPLMIVEWKTEPGVVITTLHYQRKPEGSGRVRGYAEPPDIHGTTEALAPGASGTIDLRIRVACSNHQGESVNVRYELSEYLNLGPAGSGWVWTGGASNAVPVGEVCSE